MGLIIT